MATFKPPTHWIVLLLLTHARVVQLFVWDLRTQGKLECLFHKSGTPNNLCQANEKFISLPSDTHAWTTSRENADNATGPQTFYNYAGYADKNDFHYALYKSSVSTVSGDQAALVTPLLNTSSAPVCVSFAYYMHGADLGSLYVVEKYNKTEFDRMTLVNADDVISTSTKREKLIARGSKGERWIEKKYQAGSSGQTYLQLFFTAVRGGGNRSDIAIDSIKVDSNLTNCPTDGSWGSWAWSACGVHCGAGQTTKNRTCNNPVPSANGENCRRKDFSIGYSEGNIKTWCYGFENCKFVDVACVTNCSISNGVISPVTSNEVSQNLTLAFTVNKPFVNLVLEYDGQPCLNATQSAISAQSNAIFDFGAKTVTQSGEKYVFRFTLMNLNPNADDKKAFTYVLKDGVGPSHLGGLVINFKGAASMPDAEPGNSVIPVDGVFTPWSAWTQCDKSCGTDGVIVRNRTCENPAPSIGGKECDGPLNETMSCNRFRCPNPYGGVDRELFKPFNDNDFIGVHNKTIKGIGYPDSPFNVTHLTKFEMMNASSDSVSVLARYWTYYVAEETGVHRFHLTCSSMCSIYVDLSQCESVQNVLKVVTNDIAVTEYESENATAKYSLFRKYRYCIQVLHKVDAVSLDNWLQVGVTLPNGTRYYPLDASNDRIFTAPDDKFDFVPPTLNISSREIAVNTYCPDLFYWTYQASVVWARPVGTWRRPSMGYQHENASYVNVSGLEPWTNQRMHITCVGEEYSVFLTEFPIFKTLQAPPTKPPSNFSVNLVNISVTVTWGRVPEDGRNGNITGYKLQVFTMSYDGEELGDEIEKLTMEFPVNSFQVKINYDGNFYQWFAHRVAGKTEGGVGAYTEFKKIRTPDSVPDAPPAALGLSSSDATTLIVKWRPIPRHKRNGIIIAYNLSMRFNSTGEWTTEMINGTLTKYTYYNLKKWSVYEISMSGHTRKGAGPAVTREGRTREDFPDSPPTNLTVTTAGKDTLNVSWTKVGYFAYGNIVKYAIFYRELIGGLWGGKNVPITTPNDTMFFQLTDLRAYVQYEVKVAAQSNSGIGVFTKSEIARTSEDSPSYPPANFFCNYTSSSSINCSWDRPSVEYASGVVTGYRIQYHVVDCSTAELLPNCNESIIQTVNITDTSGTSYTISNLEYFTEYNFQIQLFNIINASEYTEPFAARTDEELPSATPTNFVAYPYTTSSILLTWSPLPYGTRHGTLMGYVCYYRKLNDFNITDDMKVASRSRRDVTGYFAAEDAVKRPIYDSNYMYPEVKLNWTIQPVANEVVIAGLEKYQRYTVRLAALNRAGIGPTANLTSRCRPGFPRIAPDITVTERYAVDRITLSWNVLAWHNANGVLVNYLVSYTKIQVGGYDVEESELVENDIWLEAYSTSIEITGLTAFSKYSFIMAAVSDRGIGEHSFEPVFGRTCNCPELLTANYMRYEPYFTISKSVLDSAIPRCCETCNRSTGSPNSTIAWLSGLSQKSSHTELKVSLNNGSHLNFPIQNTQYARTYEGRPYLPIFQSSGFVVYARPNNYELSVSKAIVRGVTQLWAYGIFALAIILAYGMFIWIVHCNPLQLENESIDDFPDNYRGAGAGVWWAVTTIFRLGEGRVMVTGKLGRFFTLPAIIFGVVITCLITSGITVYLFVFVMSTTQAKVNSERVGVLDGAYDRHVVTRMGGIVSQSNLTATSLQKDLELGKISRAVVDAFFGVWHHKDLAKPGKTVSHGLIKRRSTLGVVLAGEAKPLASCLSDEFRAHADVEAKMARMLWSRNVDYERELPKKVEALGSYTTDTWITAVIVCAALFGVGVVAGCFYSIWRHTQRLPLKIRQYTECKDTFEKVANRMFADFQRRCNEKVNELEVKHAFERLHLKKEMRKNVKFLSPNDVFKYKF